MNFHLEATAVSKKPLEFLTDRAARRRAGGCFRARVLRQSLLSSKTSCPRTKSLCSGRSDICALCRGDVFCGSFLAPEAAAGWFNRRRFIAESRPRTPTTEPADTRRRAKMLLAVNQISALSHLQSTSYSGQPVPRCLSTSKIKSLTTNLFACNLTLTPSAPAQQDALHETTITSSNYCRSRFAHAFGRLCDHDIRSSCSGGHMDQLARHCVDNQC